MNMENKLVSGHIVKKADIEIRHYNEDFSNGTRIIDEWQRLDGWSLNYKETFIKAILCGADVPKIMQYTLDTDESKSKRILDGGHRTRAIYEFKNSEFGVTLEDNNCYYWELIDCKPRTKSVNQKRELPSLLKKAFDEYTLSVTTYQNIDDNEARIKFNELNHCSPMKLHEVMNSHSSHLIDFLRKEWSFISDTDSHEYSNIMKIFSLKPNEVGKLKHIRILVGLFSIIHRRGTKDEFSHYQPTPALEYVRSNNVDKIDTQFTREEMLVVWPRFTDALEKYRLNINRLFDNGFKLTNHSEAITLFGYINNEMVTISDNDINALCEFCIKYTKYRNESTPILKQMASSNENSEYLNDLYQILEKDVGQESIEWVSTFQNNGSGPTNLLKRKNIIDRILGF